MNHYELVKKGLLQTLIYFDPDSKQEEGVTEALVKIITRQAGRIKNIVFLNEEATKYYTDIEMGHMPNGRKNIVAFIADDQQVYLGAI